ncbi:MAG: DUF3105 domain-containing protein [Nocardioidaceae bacterium]|nr:DUF3105 domain-containing protein [Nocardioidaceae bacterium]
MSKSNKNRDRREMVEQMRKQAKAAERRRTLTVIAACVVVALIIVGAAVWQIVREQQQKEELANEKLTDIGTAAEQAGCAPVEEQRATGSGEHVTTPVDYDIVPPSSGPHNPTTVESGTHFFGPGERPDVGLLVHNLEHGWSVVWYDETVADDDEQLGQLEATAAKFDAEGSDPRFNMIIAPWTEEDGESIPDGKHIAFSHWSVHQDPNVVPSRENLPSESFGVSQYCDSFSGAALERFMEKYPYDDAPEGYLWH